MTDTNVSPVVQLENTTSDSTLTFAENATSGSNNNVMTLSVNTVLQDQKSHLNPDPTCKKDCRFSYGMSMTTLLYYHPIFDKHGNNVNPDGNTTSGEVSCSVCERKWSYSTRFNQTDFKEME